MSPERFRQVEELYHAALEREPEARSALLAQTDPELRREVESLLAHADGSFLSNAVLNAAATTQPVSSAQCSQIGQSVGQYRILAKIGEGGMGVVYEAEQSHPRRSVALKMIRSDCLVHAHTVRMFQREAEALARLRHSGIADVYESGQTEGGQHYFTMELVRGEPLNDYLKRLRPDMPAGELKIRLALFEKICAAVSYAHQNGVIHRDLKPSNIQVTSETAGQAVPEIKILDFGLARITGEGAGTTLVTGLHGTLAYMSPEQTRGASAEVDLRTDVYSLGVIFYEMLTGALPYEVAGKDLLPAVHAICEDEPKPFKSLPCYVKLAADLECIVRKALEKEPARRYQSVAALAEDVQRYQNGQAVLAQPPTAVYQLRKLVTRHKLKFSFAATLVLVLAAFAVAMTVQARRIAGERNRANQEAASAQQVSDFLVRLFEVSDPSEARGNTLTARELLDRGAEKIDGELKGQPAVRAHVQTAIGRVLTELGSYKKATELLEAALRNEESRPGESGPAMIETLDRVATAYQAQGEYAKAEPLFRRAVALAEKTYGPDRKETSAVLNDLGGICALRGNFAESEQLFKRSLAIIEKVNGPGHIDAAEILNNLGFVASALGHLDQSLDYQTRALHIREKSLSPDHPGLAESLANAGVILWSLKRYSEAAPLLERSLAINRKALGPDHSVVGQDMTNLANVYRDSGELTKAESLYLGALEIREKALGPQHPDVAHTLNRLAGLRQSQHKYAEAVPLFARSIAIFDQALGPMSLESALARMNFADLYRERRDFAKAEPLYSAAVASLEKTSNARLSTVLDGYARMLRDAGRSEEAAPMEERAKGIRAKAQ